MNAHLDSADPVGALEDKYIKIEGALVQSVCIAAEAQAICAERDPVLQKLVEERRRSPSDDSRQIADIRKRNKKEIRRKRNAARSEKNDDILSNFSNIEQIHAIKNRKKVDLTIGMDDETGKTTTNRSSIAEIFARFYEELDRSRCEAHDLEQTGSGAAGRASERSAKRSCLRP